MKFSKFQHKVKKILAADLPSGESVRQQGRSLAAGLTIGRTAFMNKMGVDSEMEYKRQCVREAHIMFHAHVGMSSWPATAQALTFIQRAAQDSGVRIDRAGLCLDRRMGLPPKYRDNIPAETGPMLNSEHDWMAIGQIVPIQPHMGDFMIGFPASVENTVNAL